MPRLGAAAADIMYPLTLLFLIFLLIGTVVRVWLARRQIQSVRSGQKEVPGAFAASISLDDHHKAADYTAVRTRLGIVDSLIDPILLLLWTFGGGLNLVNGVWQDLGAGPLVTGIAVILSTLLIMSLLDLPLSIFRTFVIEQRFGFNRTTPALFVIDLVKGLIVFLLIGTPIVALVLWLMNVAGNYWWVAAWIAWSAFTFLITWAYPTLIAPLFNKFEPLADDSLRSRIESLLDRCGFRSKGIFVMDGSRRSSHGNAYFTGLGNQKRIVFFDTLVESLEPPEVEAVLAHELGHFKLKHVLKRLLLNLGLSLVGFGLLGWLMLQEWFFLALGVNSVSNHMALLLFLLVIPIFTFLLTPAGAYFSRRHEFQADEYATRQTDGDALTTALVKLYRDNATTLTPDYIYSGFYDSHPPALVRIEHIARRAGTAAA